MAEYDLFAAYDFGLAVRVRGTLVHLDFDFVRPEFWGETIDELEDEALWNARESTMIDFILAVYRMGVNCHHPALEEALFKSYYELKSLAERYEKE